MPAHALYSVVVGRLPGEDEDREPTLAECVAVVSRDTAERVAREARHRLNMHWHWMLGSTGPRPKMPPLRRRKRPTVNRQTAASEFAGAISSLNRRGAA